ncbi:MAG TPA: GGDEF domain-containing protein [Microthrixaceae bacterium]|nr:GGDEF domain-containing protein [Microthrixaceae bacterium]
MTNIGPLPSESDLHDSDRGDPAHTSVSPDQAEVDTDHVGEVIDLRTDMINSRSEIVQVGDGLDIDGADDGLAIARTLASSQPVSTPAGNDAPAGSAPQAKGRDALEGSDALEVVERGTITRSVLRIFMPVAVVILVAALVGAAMLVASRSKDSSAQNLTRSLDHEQQVSVDREELWTGLLGLAATGVGAKVTNPPEVSELIGRASANTPGPLPSSLDEVGQLKLARQSHDAFTRAAGEAMSIEDGSPLSIANELGAIGSSHDKAVSDHNAYRAQLDASRDGAQDASTAWSLAALAVFVAGMIAAVVLALRAKKQTMKLVESPAQHVASAVAGVASGDTTARSGVSSIGGIGAVAHSIDSSLDLISTELEQWRTKAEWGERSGMIFEALDEAEDEAAAYRVIERALGMIDDHYRVELLVSDRGSNRLRLVTNGPDAGGPGSVVGDENATCVAMRRGQVSVFRSSESINACPLIQNLTDGPCSAACVPIWVSGRPAGVFHMIGTEFDPPGEELVARLVTLSVQLGNRLSALSTLERSRREASTDGLTGLPNRRMLQSEVLSLIDREVPFVMVLADLDKFKRLNDNYGHEVGDKALKLFSGVLKGNVRGNDLVARIGGEEFVLVYPNMSVETSLEAIGRLRQALATAVASSRLPAFTCSFGISDSNAGADGESILRVADAGLLKAKELGGDQAVYADVDLVQEIFGSAAERPSSTDPDRI